MSTTVTLRAPGGQTSGVVQTTYGSFAVGSDGSVSVDSRSVAQLLNAGFSFFGAKTSRHFIPPCLAADLVYIVAAATVANGTPTIAHQPDVPRKLQVRLVYTSGPITAGTLTIVGINGSGSTITETLSLITAASLTQTTANAYAHITSLTVAGLVGGAGVTLGIGHASALALPLPANFQDLSVFKETVISISAGTWTTVDEAIGTVDTIAGTVIPTTAPDGAHGYSIDYTYNS